MRALNPASGGARRCARTASIHPRWVSSQARCISSSVGSAISAQRCCRERSSSATLSLFCLFGVWQRHIVDLLKPNDLARQLAVSRAWVYEAARTGRIPSVRIGGEDGPLRFIPEDIDRWLADARTAWSPGRGTSAEDYEPATRPSRASPHRVRRSAAETSEQQSLL